MMQAGSGTTERFLQTLFASSPFGIALFDPAGRYLGVNERLVVLNGRTADDHVGRSIAEVVPAEAASLVQSTVDRTVATRQAQTISTEVTAPGVPELTHFGLSTFPVLDDEDEVMGVVALVLDVQAPPWAARDVGQLIEVERTMRGRAESAGRRAAFLAEASTALDSSLDLSTTLRTLARIVVPELADVCLVDMVVGREPPEVQRLAVAHRDPEQDSYIWDLTRRWPSAPELRRGIRRVLAEGSTEFIPEVTEEILDAAFPNAEHRERVRELGLSSSIIVPIRARGRTLGAITFARIQDSSQFTAADVALAEELTRRAALAVDNARLHTDLRRADRAQRLISEASRILSESLDWSLSVDHLARVLTEDFADLCVIEDLDDTGALRVAALGLHDPGFEEQLADGLRRWPLAHRASFVAPALEGGRSTLVSDFGEAEMRQLAMDDNHFELMRMLGMSSVLVVPMVSRGGPVGALSFAMTGPQRRFDEVDLRLAEELGRRAGVAAENARLYADRSRVARTLQRSLLPAQLPRIPGIEAAVRFRAAGDGSEVGGDFYDVFQTGDDAWCAVVGDVCGKGAEAASLTALARHTVRAAARYEHGPAGVLVALNDAIDRQAPVPIFATAAVAWITAGPDDALVRVARGGQLPPLVLRADGRVEELMARGSLLGVFPDVELAELDVRLGPGDAIVLYTDGVTEAGAPDRALGEDGLRAGLATFAGRSAESIARSVELLARNAAPGLRRDDLAVLVLRFTG